MSTETVTPELNTYDEVPYASFPFAQTHPNRLATVATLFGMQPKRPDDCRVLELGCASGGNIIPMAVSLPKSEFVGIDLSSRQIALGQETVDSLRLGNIELLCRSIADVTPNMGQFDYIVCHGVWSWVAHDVRKKIFEICAEQLTPQGVAYISYNTYPGWHLRGSVRDMMFYHTRNLKEPRERVGQARALLDFLVRSVPEEKGAYPMLLKGEMELLRNKGDYYLLHEHLEHVNEPVYFYEFEAQASAERLQFLGEADIGSMLAEDLGSDVQPILNHVAKNVIEREQYLDFLRNRTFRQTLLCHKDLELNRRPDYERVRKLYVASPVQPLEGSVNVISNEESKFKGVHGTVSTPDPLMKAALLRLGQRWPEAISFQDLLVAIQQELYNEPVVTAARINRDASSLVSNLIQCYIRKFVDFYAVPSRCQMAVSERPQASPLARSQAQGGKVITNLNHEVVEISDLPRHVLQLLDGSRDRQSLLNAMVELLDRGEIVIPATTNASGEPTDVRMVLADTLDKVLHQLGRDCLLLA